MRKRFIPILLSFVVALTTMAKPITLDEALERLSTAKDIPAAAKGLYGSQSTAATETLYTGSNSAAVYLYKVDDVMYVLPADDSVTPLIGYSTNVSSLSDLPNNLRWWLSEYARQIEYLQSKSASTLISTEDNSSESSTTREDILPLLSTNWAQGEPYNNLCPTVNGSTAITGCVATSMAQVMNYHKYPDIGVGSITYTDLYENTYSMDFTEQFFNWQNMLDEYSDQSWTDEQANAVAYLMKACGYASEMNYNPVESDAVAYKPAFALYKNFSYNSNIAYIKRDLMDDDVWDDLLYQNIKTVGPVIYDGRGSVGGHSFVCDGYSAADDSYHFNWGWAGNCNGYYKLSLLQPEEGGIEFSYSQGAIFNITSPDKATIDIPYKCPITVWRNIDGKYDNGVYIIEGLLVTSILAKNVEIAIRIVNEDTGETTLANIGTLDVSEEYYSGSKITFPLPLKAGKYKLYPLAREFGNEEWYEFNHNSAYTNYINVEVDEDENVNIYGEESSIVVTNLKVWFDVDSSAGDVMYSFDIENKSNQTVFLQFFPIIIDEKSQRISVANKLTYITLEPGVVYADKLFVDNMQFGEYKGYEGNAYFGILDSNGQKLAEIPITVVYTKSDDDGDAVTSVDASKSVVSSEVYTIDGRKLNTSDAYRGIVIKKETLSDGTTRVLKEAR